MLLLIVLLYAKNLTISVLILQNVCVLFALEPGILQIEKQGLACSTFKHLLHAFAVIEVPGVKIGIWRTGDSVFERCPLGVRKVLEIIVDFQIGLWTLHYRFLDHLWLVSSSCHAWLRVGLDLFKTLFVIMVWLVAFDFISLDIS